MRSLTLFPLVFLLGCPGGNESGKDDSTTGTDDSTGSDDSTANNDADADGYDSVASGGDDCDDSDASVNPGATEVAGDG